MEPYTRTVLEQIGAESGCRKLAAVFYTRVGKDATLRPLFPGKSLRCATEEFAAFLIQLLDGDQAQTSYRCWLSLRESHGRFSISEAQRVAWLRCMENVLEAVVDDLETRKSLTVFFRVGSLHVAGEDPASSAKGQPWSAGWARQRALDALVDLILRGEDAEAIQCAQRLELPASMEVGVLARLMEFGRAALLEYTLERIDQRPELGQAHFNGRSLLHHGSGHACIPVVIALLTAGGKPNSPDQAGHSPLYRAAGAKPDQQASQVVAALLTAGAFIDHAGGTNRSTALHQAARFGNVEVTKTLLAAGANRELRDRNGLTPLDRARNCRRPGVVEILALG